MPWSRVHVRLAPALLGVVVALTPGACTPIAPSPALRDAVRDLSGQLAVFPGAQGYGTTTTAGRRGEVIRVTNLAAEGPGSLRAALATAGARTVVFEVAGVIATNQPLVIGD